jgi:hypothetical protein
MSDDQLARLRQLLDQSETLETEAEILQWCAEFDRLMAEVVDG